LIYHWYIANKKKYIFSFSLNGFAKKIFKKKNKKLNSKIDFIITGTGKIKHKYINAIKYGKKNNIKTISFLDHYVNYNSRFVYKKISILPDEIWTFDNPSFLMAKKFYKTTKIYIKKNFYLDFLKKKYRIYLKKKLIIKKYLNILFLSEPSLINKNLKKEISQNIFIFLNQYNKKIKLIFRLHPSEKNNDLLKNISTVIINKKNINFSVDKNLSITKSLYEADIVIGGETYAMVLALKLKKKVYTYLPVKSYPFNLPFKKIKKI
jgi:hypothetical protein